MGEKYDPQALVNVRTAGTGAFVFLKSFLNEYNA